MESIYKGNMVEIFQVTPQIFFRKADLSVRGQCNSVFIVGENCVGVVDPSTPEAADEILEEIKLLFDNKPLRYAFLTHHHNDHALGLRNYANMDITVFCTHRCVDEMAQLIGGNAAVVGVKGLMRILLDGIPVEVYPLEDTAHSANDTFIRFPKEGFVCTGDFVAEYRDMYFHQCDLARWISNLREYEVLPYRKILPGHGDIFPYSRMKETADYLEVLGRAAAVCAARSPEGETPAHIALLRNQLGGPPANTRGLYKDIGIDELNKLVTDYLAEDSPEALTIKKNAQEQAPRQLRTVLRKLRSQRQQ